MNKIGENSSNIVELKVGQYVFCCGGNDAEMQTIQDRLIKTDNTIIDKKLGWGAKASEYEAEIENAISHGKIPVLIELSLEGLSEKYISMISSGKIKSIDHHGERSGEAASILQVIELLQDVPNRIESIIAANDSGYIPAMKKAGANEEEITSIRLLERQIQGITPEMEQEAEGAISQMERFPELNDLIVIRMKHSKSATITDRLYGTQEKEHILIISEDGEVNYYGDGVICAKLKEKFEGWNGGSGLGKSGDSAFWGGYSKELFGIFSEIQKTLKEKDNFDEQLQIIKKGKQISNSLPIITESGNGYAPFFNIFDIIQEPSLNKEQDRPIEIIKQGFKIIQVGTITYKVDYEAPFTLIKTYTDRGSPYSGYRLKNCDQTLINILNIKKL